MREAILDRTGFSEGYLASMPADDRLRSNAQIAERVQPQEGNREEIQPGGLIDRSAE